MRQPRFLILGASGSIGSHLYGALGRERAIATYNSNPVADAAHFDARAMRLTDSILRPAHDVTHAIILQGLTNIDACARDPAGSHRVNVDSVCRVIDDLLDHDILPVFISSDAVFDGSRGGWAEDDAAHPVLTYGRQKLEVEHYLREKSRDYLIVRLAKVVGTRSPRGDMLENWLDALETGETIRCARNQIFSPVHVDDVVTSLVKLAEAGSRGVFHLGGPAALSRLELLETLIEEVGKFQRPVARISACTLEELNFDEPRPLDSSLCSAKLNALIGSESMNMQTACELAVARRFVSPRRDPVASLRTGAHGKVKIR